MLLQAFCCLALLATAWPCALGSQSSSRSVVGTLVVPAAEYRKLPADTVVTLRGVDGSQQTTYPRADGSFKFFSVANGEYHVDVDALGFQFLQMKVVVKGRAVKAVSPELPPGQEVPYPLRIPAIGLVQYFDAKSSFNLMAWLKTPYGMMLAFMVSTMVILPYLKVDAEEYKQMIEEKKKVTDTFTGTGRNK